MITLAVYSECYYDNICTVAGRMSQQTTRADESSPPSTPPSEEVTSRTMLDSLSTIPLGASGGGLCQVSILTVFICELFVHLLCASIFN